MVNEISSSSLKEDYDFVKYSHISKQGGFYGLR